MLIVLFDSIQIHLDIIFYLFFDLIKFLYLLLIMGIELIWSFPLQSLRNDFISFRLILLTFIELLDTGHSYAFVVAKLTEMIFFLKDLLVIDELVISIVEIQISISFLTFFTHCTRSLYITLLHNLFIKFVCDIIKFGLLSPCWLRWNWG